MFELGTMQKAFVAWLKKPENADKQITGNLGYVVEESGKKDCMVCVLGALLLVKGASDRNYTLPKDDGTVFLVDRPKGFAYSYDEHQCLKYSWQELGLYSETGTMLKPFYDKGLSYCSLASLNDDAKLTFQQIAELIEKDPYNFFCKSV